MECRRAATNNFFLASAVLLLALLGLMAPAPASAQPTGCVVADNCAEGTAQSLAAAAGAWCASANGSPWVGDVHGPYPHTNGTHAYYVARMTNGSGGFNGCSILPQTQFFFLDAPNPCEDKEGDSYTGWQYASTWPPVGTGCASASECQISIAVESAPVPNGSGLIAYWATSTYTGEQCDPDDPTPEEPGEDDAGDGWKCDPATGLCTDPDGNGKLCTFNPDGSRSACVDYKPGDGTDPGPEEPEEPNDPRENDTASGGGNCTAAPACSGPAIDCAMLWQQWKTRCEVSDSRAKLTGSNATCSAALSTGYSCIGDAATCRNLNDTHAIRCAVSELANAEGGPGGPGGEGDDPFDKAGERAAIDAAGNEENGLGGVTPEDAWHTGDDSDMPGTGFFGGGGGCPAFPAVNIGPVAFQRPDAFCDYVAMLRLLFLVLGTIWAYQIVIGD